MKTVWRKPHGFESHPLRHTCGGQFACRSFFIYISLDNIDFATKNTPAVGNRISQFIHRLRIKHDKKKRKPGRAVTPHKPSFFTVYTEKTVIILFHYYNIEVFLLSLCRIRLRERGMSICTPYNECNCPATLAYRR